MRAADHQVRSRDEGGGFISTGAPDFAVGNEVAEDDAAVLAWAGIVNRDGFSGGELALCGCGRTWALGFVLLGADDDIGDGQSEYSQTTNS